MAEQFKKVAKLFYDRFFSKKLFAFLIATALLWFSKIGEDVWQFVAVIYIGTQGVYDAAMTWKHGKSNDGD